MPVAPVSCRTGRTGLATQEFIFLRCMLQGSGQRTRRHWRPANEPVVAEMACPCGSSCRNRTFPCCECASIRRGVRLAARLRREGQRTRTSEEGLLGSRNMLKPLPALRTPQRPPQKYARDLPAGSALQFLAAGWADFRAAPLQSFAYGLILTLLSYAVIALLAWAGLLYLTLPSLSGFLIIGPFLAVGLYETARRHALGQTVSLKEMLLLQPASGAQLAYAGLLLCLLVLFWLRAADLLYALFFGLSPFP